MLSTMSTCVKPPVRAARKVAKTIQRSTRFKRGDLFGESLRARGDDAPVGIQTPPTHERNCTDARGDGQQARAKGVGRQGLLEDYSTHCSP